MLDTFVTLESHPSDLRGLPPALLSEPGAPTPPLHLTGPWQSPSAPIWAPSLPQLLSNWKNQTFILAFCVLLPPLIEASLASVHPSPPKQENREPYGAGVRQQVLEAEGRQGPKKPDVAIPPPLTIYIKPLKSLCFLLLLKLVMTGSPPHLPLCNSCELSLHPHICYELPFARCFT